MKVIIFVLAIVIFFSSGTSAEVYLSAEEATKRIFPHLEKFQIESHILENQEFKVFTVISGGQVTGWTVQVDEMGKIHPITFLVGIGKEGEILEVYVLEYRDMFGTEVRRRSFLKQFQGKTSKDPLLVGRDIDAVTQATISSQATATAVKKSLEVVQQIKKTKR